MLVELVEVKIAQFVVGDLVGKEVVNSYQDLMGHGHDCPLVAAASFETVEFVSLVAWLLLLRWQPLLELSSDTHCP